MPDTDYEEAWEHERGIDGFLMSGSVVKDPAAEVRFSELLGAYKQWSGTSITDDAFEEMLTDAGYIVEEAA